MKKCIDYLKVVPDLCSETCLTPSHDGNQVISIKAEDFTDTENEEDDPLLIQFPVIKPEFEQNIDLIKVENDVDILSEEDSVGLGTDEVYVPSVFSIKKPELENCVEVPSSCSETRLPSSHDGNEVIDIKVEGTTYVQEQEDSLLKNFPAVQTDHESLLNEGNLIHGEERAYSCNVCNKSFSWRSHLMIHQRIHSGERPYTCDVCNKSFGRRNHLKIHQSTHSGEQPHSCDVCNKAFSRRSLLKRHLHVHSGERPYSCHLCNKSFSQRSHLKVHQRIHSGERPYSCNKCDKSFSRRSILKGHMLIFIKNITQETVHTPPCMC
ncbi:zinc finger and SCAN domain-containing protein 5B-like [Zootermopsis nevadensis]|uniref:zinc finger and SCAN domain-containing protein 5B-like n=1 Tax=Zootermopsis nevadensis TaxID=136037 RepID=UPI000B8E4186|nr:zinc finger and SCAN domain-containing protein 5B-like [Zootermopsis nevadensis]